MKRLLSISLLVVALASAVVSCKKTPVELMAPTISKVDPGTNSAAVSWSAVENATSYSAQLRTAGGEWGNAKASSTTSVTFDGLQPKTDYEVRVQAEGGEGFSTSPFSAPFKFTTLEAAPTQLSTPEITGVVPAAKSAEVTWNAVAGASSYSLQLRPADGEWADAGSSATTSATVSDLMPQTEYEVRVKASGSGITDSEYSDAVKFTTTEISVSYPLTISNADDFVFWINEKASSCQAGDLVTLAADIDLAGKALTPVIAFYGTLDGNGKTLKNLSLTNALFEMLEESGVVKNLNVDGGSSINWTDEIPDMTGVAFIASKSKGSIIGCSVAGSIKVNTATAGRIYCAGVVGESEAGYVEGCKFSGSIDVELSGTSASCSAISGVAARVGNAEKAGQVIVKDCENTGSIKFNFSGPSKNMKKFGIGGVVGQTPSVTNADKDHGIIEGCVNKGNIEWKYEAGGSGSYPALGGVAGIVEGQIKSCENYGKISYLGGKDVAATDASIGGVAGYVTLGASGCNNHGEIVVDGTLAGGTSMAQSGGNTSYSTIGGVFGNAGPYAADNTYCGDQGIIVDNCHNDASFHIKPYMVTTGGPQMCFGGVIGASTASMTNCENKGNIVFESQIKTINAGGVVGFLEADMDNCTNSGNVTLDGAASSHPASVTVQCYFGGVFGIATKGSVIKNVKNSGDVTFQNMYSCGKPADETYNILSYVGGINGSYKGAITITGAENSGKVVNKTDLPICLGGVSGALNGTLANGKNSGAVVNESSWCSTVKGKQPEVGGVVGYANAVFSGCSNTGDVTNAPAGGFTGGFVGSHGEDKEAAHVWDDCTVNCAVSGPATAGSVLGRFRYAPTDPAVPTQIDLGSSAGAFSISGAVTSLPLVGVINGHTVNTVNVLIDGKPSGGAQVPFTEDLANKKFTYDGKDYPLVKLADGRWWMAAPLAYVPEGKTVSSDPVEDAGIWYTYTTDGTNVSPRTDFKDGYLYDYPTAFGVAQDAITYGTRDEYKAGTKVGNFRDFEGVQGICPPGWYIPTRADFLKLVGASTKDDSLPTPETAAVEDASALYWVAADKGSNIPTFNAAGWNFSFLGVRAKNSTTATGAYNKTITKENTCSVSEWVGKPALNEVMCSTPYMPNTAGTTVQYFCLMTTFTSTYMQGRLSLSYANYLYGVEVRCIRKAD
ncbi:MAG: fibronectin type III domain-containing protein [Bacteroidales bacterium]|nr:fibronectin type III domain-containing protein [Bacteroidales bacterium]